MVEARGIHVHDYYELSALHRALMEAKFVEIANSRDVAGSPYVAGLAHRVLDALIRQDEERKGPQARGSWEEWRKLDSSRREWKIGVRRAKEQSDWDELSGDEKSRLGRDLLAPCEVEAEQVAEFVKEVDG